MDVKYSKVIPGRLKKFDSMHCMLKQMNPSRQKMKKMRKNELGLKFVFKLRSNSTYTESLVNPG